MRKKCRIYRFTIQTTQNLMSEEDLRARLEKLQSENAELYARISMIKKQNRPEVAPMIVGRKRDLGSIKAQLAQEESLRTERKAKLKDVTAEHEQLEKTLDLETYEMEHELGQKASERGAQLKEHFEAALEFFKGSAQFQEIEALVKEILKKQHEFETLQDDIEKTEKMIGMNKDEGDVVTGVVNSQAVPSFEARPPTEEPPEDSPLPCMSRKPQSLENARSRRRVSFQTGVLNM